MFLHEKFNEVLRRCSAAHRKVKEQQENKLQVTMTLFYLSSSHHSQNSLYQQMLEY